jgi:NADH:ubiquinone oxidoreductase subunit F (NADH-binding)/Pyruvate/2-oxoacid:ferredoxin oxidoreductase delta subunit/(2Fe-2S) ferredoxin
MLPRSERPGRSSPAPKSTSSSAATPLRSRRASPRSAASRATSPSSTSAPAPAASARARARRSTRSHKWTGEHGYDVELVEVGCIGLCSDEPLVDVQLPGRPRVSFRRVDKRKAPKLLDKVFSGEIPQDDVVCQFPAEGSESWLDVPLYSEHPFFAPQTRWVLENCGHLDPYSIDEYLARGGYRAAADVLRGKSPREVCDEVIDAGLRGRGGGGFPAGRKWKIALEQPAEQKYMICNADEGDPGAFMDRAVIEGDPHRLVEGMLIAAYAIGATKSYVYIRAEYPLAIERLRLAIDQARELGLLGDDLFGTGFEFDIKIKMGAGAFVCGEETAILASVEGKRGMPRPRPPFPAVSGLWGKPTILNNVETLANLPFLMREGAATFSGVGTAGSKGTKVFALSGKVSRTGLVEVAMGTTVRDIIFGIGGGIPHGKQYKAVQMGGPSGGCIPEQHLDIEVDYDSLLEVGAMMGSGGMVAMDEDTCMVDVAKFFMDFIQRESCGKCIPCREGTRRMLEILTAITRPTREESGHDALSRFQGVIELEKLAGVIKDTSLCGLGQSAPNPVLSTLRWFRHEYEAHVFERSCPAAACLGLLSYSIDADACKGCTLCAKNCPTGAILGDRKEVHRIDQERCIACGSCITSCEFDAVIAK